MPGGTAFLGESGGMRRLLLVLLTLVVGVAGGLALAVWADVRTFPGVDARRTSAEPAATATVTATATATVTMTPTPSEAPTYAASPTRTAAPSPTSAPATKAPTKTAAPTPTAPPAGGVALRVRKEGSYVVRTSSGSVSCFLLNYFGDRWAECLVRKPAFGAPKRPASCEYDWAPQFTLKAGATYGACRSDMNDVDSTTVLGPGQSAVDGPLTCTASARGDSLECRNSGTGHGFEVSRDDYRLF